MQENQPGDRQAVQEFKACHRSSINVPALKLNSHSTQIQ